ncbi:tRNA pseudouridine synthase A [Coriobacterium glomerans PW2]|uniref:tRNA pseudouridine synthase A n=1 Tax=Coriobacterium glomerans (strain ATCC 49209 / DSM 20642 / JCM 10262 / PW2) TaxID=700015 RepID=F2N8L7_CORGP|nr:tRNA pseudouridine(38-40) synthase TruA [Coriobacterium glomerans]AEB07400.1 tRNA pseudouridine synthase A [Coriobacterium glomerans PW2]
MRKATGLIVDEMRRAPGRGCPTTDLETASGCGAAAERFSATLVLKLGYDGTRYSGFAEQPDRCTVAGEVRQAMETFLRRPIELICAGRTDAGVHAIGQHVSVAVLPAECEIPRARWLRAMDALLPPDISVAGVFRARRGFSARFDARDRTYTYRIAAGSVRPALIRPYVWWHRLELDEGAMRDAATCLVGEHDFKSFCRASSAAGRPTSRRVLDVDFAHESELGENVLAFTIRGNAFLHSMVRTIVGSLAEVGTHRRDPAWLADALAARDRAAAGPTAPACGLCFMDVSYDSGELEGWL